MKTYELPTFKGFVKSNNFKAAEEASPIQTSQPLVAFVYSCPVLEILDGKKCNLILLCCSALALAQK